MLIGEFVGPFEIVAEIGYGAMGTVYKAKWHLDGKTVPVALKVIAIGLASNEGAMARFEREANILKQLRHPNIVRLYGTGRYRKTPFISMEFINGEGLDLIFGRRGRMNWEDVVGYAKQLCEALQHAHEKGIIHRDLKPSNLMITSDGQLKLTDFGIAKDSDVTALTGANSTIGTAAYMSPEQCKGDRNLSSKSDLYSLGVVLYELVTGKKPFSADTTVELFLKHVNEKPVRPGKLVPDLPIWLDNLIMFLLEKDKAQRPLDAATVLRILTEIEEKVSAQLSVGAEVANARRVDRPLREGLLDESDKHLARALRSPGKKRKRKRSIISRVIPWLKGFAILAALLAIIAVPVYVLWPEGMDDSYKRVMAASSGDDRINAASNFLERFHENPDPRVNEVRELFKSEKIRGEEGRLSRRHSQERMRKNPEGYDEEAYEAALLAMDAEADGQLVQAAVQWEIARTKSPTIDPNAIANADSKVVLGWVAEKRIRDNQREVPASLKQLQDQIANDRLYEVDRTYKNPHERLATLGLRLEQFGDKSKAKSFWAELIRLTEKDLDQRVWYLMAKYKSREIGPLAESANTVEARQRNLNDKFFKLTAEWATVKDNPEARVSRRNIRNGYRDIIDLYEDETADPLKAVVERARELLKAIPK